MRRWCGVFVLCTAILMGACASGASMELSEVEQTELVELNRQILEEMIEEQDPTLLQNVAFDDFLVIAPGGRVETLPQVVAGVESFSSDAMASVTDQRVIWRDGVAVVIGKLVIDGEMQPVGELPPLKFMTVFLRHDGQWRLMARSLTACFPIAIQRGVC